MGNCLRRESPTQWGGDDWGSPAPDGFNFATKTRQLHGTKLDKRITKNMALEEEDELLGGDQRGFTSTSPPSSSIDYVPIKAPSRTEIKIKITRKQLEELLARVDVKEISVQQVLAQLINVAGSDKFGTDQAGSVRSGTSWRPKLQSIPE